MSDSTARFALYSSPMPIYLTDESARGYWNRFAGNLGEAAMQCGATCVKAAVADLDGLKQAHIPRCAIVNKRLHLLVGSASERRSSRHVTSHICTQELPADAFKRIDDNLLIASPELLFVRLANRLSLAETVKMGTELCGTYLIDPSDTVPKERPPLTSTKKLRTFTSQMGPSRGISKARKALEYVVDGSNSPMETALEMLLCLPCRYGGCGLPKPEMNYRINLTKREAQSSGHCFYKCDLYWREAEFALEYYGRDWHTGAVEVARDVRRLGELQAHGVNAAVVTFEQISSVREVELLARRTARALNVRLCVPREKGLQARNDLHKLLVG